MASERLKARVNVKKRRKWRNKHQTHSRNLERMIDVWNPKGSPSLAGLKATIKALQGIIRDAIRKDKRVRALGSNWSLSDVAATEDWMINTKPLNWIFPLSERSVSDHYPGDPKHLTFAQCGVAILELSNYLEPLGRSLKTSGASNGQTIAGALSTGTHGSAIDVGAIPDYVVGLHLIVGASRHVWLERASYPVTADDFAGKLGAELIRDDTLFNAALVSFGSFGIIHGVVIETEDLFLLNPHAVRIPYDDTLEQAIDTLDFSNLSLPHGTERPYHVELVFNPYDVGQKGARSKIMYKEPYDDTHETPEPNTGGFQPGDDAAGFIGLLTDAAPAMIPILLNGLFDQLYKPLSPERRTLSEMFYNTEIRGKAAGSALGVPQAMASKALETALAVHKAHGPFAAVVALRFVPASKGLLAFTRFPQTCIVDLDGVASKGTTLFFEEVWQAFEDAGIPFTMHWGKANEFLNPMRIRQMYGDAAVDQWITSRHTLLDEPTRRAFTNAFLERCGLDR